MKIIPLNITLCEPAIVTIEALLDHLQPEDTLVMTEVQNQGWQVTLIGSTTAPRKILLAFGDNETGNTVALQIEQQIVNVWIADYAQPETNNPQSMTCIWVLKGKKM